jgi:DNA-binding GntR family transcriptional regulator
MPVNWGDYAAERGAVPAYVQLADFIAARIEDGSIAHGEQLPADRDLAQKAGHSVETAAKAKRVLVERGLAATGRGLGTFVTA